MSTIAVLTVPLSIILLKIRQKLLHKGCYKGIKYIEADPKKQFWEASDEKVVLYHTVLVNTQVYVLP